MIEQHMIDHGVTVLMSTECKEINGENGRVTSVAIGDGTILETDLVGFATGVWPNSSMAKESKIPINKGILVNEYLQTEVDDIYAAGDCVERKSVVHNETAISAIWYSSRDMGITAARNLLGDNVMFSQGSWYNSAKFLDLEYTSVGHYLPKSEKEQNIFIKDQQKEVSIRIVHEQNICKGFSMLGSRWDHTVLQRFIDEQRTVEYFFDNISKTQFDPEFMNRNLTLKKNSK